MQLKYSCLFKHDIGGAALQCVSLHDVLKSAKNFQVFCFCLSGAIIQKDTCQWIIKQSPHDLRCFFCVFSFLNLTKCQEHYCKQSEGWLWEEGYKRDKGRIIKKQQLRGINKAHVAPSGTIFHPHISRTWHLFESMENDCRWELKENDLTLTFGVVDLQVVFKLRRIQHRKVSLNRRVVEAEDEEDGDFPPVDRLTSHYS